MERSIYERVVDQRNKNGTSIRLLQTELGLANGTVNKRANATPKTDTLLKTADCFRVTIKYLMKGGEKEDSETYYLNKETKELA